MPREKHIKNVTFTQNESVDFHFTIRTVKGQTQKLFIKKEQIVFQKS